MLNAAATATSAPVAPLTAAPPVVSAVQSAAPLQATGVAAPSSSTSTEVQTDDFMERLKKAVSDGALGDAMVADIKKQFTAPFSTTPTANDGSATAAPVSQTVMAFGQQQPGAAAGQQLSGATSSLLSNVVQLTAAAESHHKSSNSQHAAVAVNFLNLLLMCDSGFNNSYEGATPNADREAAIGLHAAVGSIATSAAANMVAYVKKVVTSSALTSGPFSDALQSYSVLRSSDSMVGDFDFGSGRPATHSSNPVLLVAQCLYVLTRHFQMQAAFVKDILEVIDLILGQIKRDMVGRDVRFGAFRESPETAATCTLTWLVVFSCVNALTTWKKLRASPSGALEVNGLLRSDVTSTLDAAIRAMRHKYETHSTKNEADTHYQFLPSVGVNHSVGRPPLRNDGKLLGGYGNPAYRWLAVVEGFLSVLTLAEGCFLRSKGDDKGYDKALEAFLGDREANRTTMCRGKVTKRMVQLAPSASTLYIPIEYIYITPYEILSYLFDDMLPLLRHLADLELSSCGRYVDQMQMLDELPRHLEGASGWNRVGSNGMLVYGASGDEQVSRGAGAAQTGKMMGSIFTSEMAHILECLAVCLANLPPEVLNPDLDADCAATFFIFRNCVKHMSQVFKAQRGTSMLWENFILKLVSQFVSVLTMIARNPQYIVRVVAALTGAQADCEEMQWANLVNQALECAGLSSANNSSGGATSGGGAGGGAMPGLSGRITADDVYTTDVGGKHSGHQRAIHRQFTREYACKCQREYISSFFLLLRQMFAHPVLRQTVRECLTLELALAFIFAPLVSQSMLGSTLSLISSLVTDATEAATVWSFFDQHRLLQAPQYSAAFASQRNGDRDSIGTPTLGLHSTTGVARDHSESLSVIGHCQYESTQGTYNITIGFLNLMIALFRYDVPAATSLATYTTVTNFIAQEIFRGVSRRAFVWEPERFTVVALAAAALRQSLLVRFTTEAAGAAVPFTTIMATSKAPSDVLGEALLIVLKASSSPSELLSYQRAAVRQCLRLIISAIHTVQAQKVEIFSFDTRTTQNVTLAVNLMSLCNSNDVQLINTVLELLLLFPHETMNQASQLWNADFGRFSGVLSIFAVILRPSAQVPVVVLAPPELAMLDPETNCLHCASESTSLLLDLLIEHASTAEPSTTAWVCGFYTAIAAPEAELTSTAVLDAVLEGAASRHVDVTQPSLAVKYMKLLYLLRANRLYGSGVIRSYIATGCQSLFLGLQQFRPDMCAPVLLSKHAYVLKLLALEACFTYSTTPDDLHVGRVTISSIPVEVLLSLLHPREVIGDAAATAFSQSLIPVGGGEDGDADGNEVRNLHNSKILLRREISADITQWLSQALGKLPVFPTCSPIAGASLSSDMYVARAADGVVQFNIKCIYDALQLNQLRQQLPLLSVDELRDRLRPYVEANECFLIYASAVNFVEGWCQLVDISCCVVKGLSLDRMRQLITCILRRMDTTTTMTVAAQEQVACRLFSSLSTIVAHLKRRVEEEVEEELQRSLADGVLTSTVGRGSGRLAFTNRYDSIAMGTSALSNTAGVVDATRSYRSAGQHQSSATTATAPAGSNASTLPLSRRRQRSGSVVGSGFFATAAGDHSNLLCAITRANATGIGGAVTTMRRDEGAVTSTGAANQSLLRPLVAATVNWGTRIAPVRADLYAALLCFSMIPGVVMDDVALYRSQGALFELLAGDISSPTVTPTTLRNALTLLVRLLQTSRSLCSSFCCASEDTLDGLGPLAVRCAEALLSSVDSTIFNFVTKAGADIGGTFWLTRSTFDLLSVMSQHHSPQVLRSHLVDMCLTMESWNLSSLAILGHTDEATERFAPGARLESNKEMMRRLLLGAVRWFNVMLSSLGDAPSLIAAMQSFVRLRQQLLESMLVSPLASLSVRRINTISLTLYAELTELLHALSACHLAEECRTLVQEMALPELLLTMAAQDFTEAHIFQHDAVRLLGGRGTALSRPMVSTMVETSGASQGGRRGHPQSPHNFHDSAGAAALGVTGQPANDAQKDLIALTVRNLAHFLLRSEYGLRGALTHGRGPPSSQLPAYPMLRHNTHHIACVVRVTAGVAEHIEQGGGACDGAGFGVSAAAGSGAVAGELHELRLESYLYALHALVCLLHTFVLPLFEGHKEGLQSASYVRSLPIRDILNSLKSAQHAVYSLRGFNTDYRTGLVAQQQSTGGWAVSANSLSNSIAQTLMRDSSGRQQRRDPSLHDSTSGATENSAVPSTRTLLVDGSAPTTPLVTSGVPRKRASSSTPLRADDGATVPTFSHVMLRGSDGEHRSVTNRLSTVTAQQQGGRVPNDTQMMLTMEVNSGTQRLEEVRVAESDVGVCRGATIGALVPASAENVTVLHSGTADFHDGDMLADPDTWGGIGVGSWQEVLHVETAVRQLKIAIANAMRAVKAISETE